MAELEAQVAAAAAAAVAAAAGGARLSPEEGCADAELAAVRGERDKLLEEVSARQSESEGFAAPKAPKAAAILTQWVLAIVKYRSSDKSGVLKDIVSLF